MNLTNRRIIAICKHRAAFWRLTSLAVMLSLVLLDASHAVAVEPRVDAQHAPTDAVAPLKSGFVADAKKIPASTIAKATRIAPSPPMGSASFIRNVNSLEASLFEDATDGRWDLHSQLVAALIAGGVNEEARIRRLEERVDEICLKLATKSQQENTPRSPERQADFVLRFLHANVLKGYQLSCSSVADTLEQGRYNCVTASVLFNCLARRIGLNAVAVETPGHAMSRVYHEGKSFDVETTCANWFELADAPEARASATAAVTRHVAPGRVPATFASSSRTASSQSGNAADNGSGGDQRREVTPVELVATIYYNRGVEYLQQTHFDLAAEFNAKALYLDPKSHTAWGNLMATINNWSIALAGEDRFEEAIALLDRGIKMDPEYTTFLANHLHVYHRWSRSLCGEKRYDDAIILLERAEKTLGDDVTLQRIRSDTYREAARHALQSRRFETGLERYDEARAALGAESVSAAQEVSDVCRVIAQLLQEQYVESAMDLADEALERYPNSYPLHETRCHVIVVWSTSAREQGDYAEAIRRARQGLSHGRLESSLAKHARTTYWMWIDALRRDGRLEEASAVARQAEQDEMLSVL